VEAVNRHLNSNVGQVLALPSRSVLPAKVRHYIVCTNRIHDHTQGAVGYDVAIMRLNYQRLKWDSSAMQRILHGDTSRGRRCKAQGVLSSFSALARTQTRTCVLSRVAQAVWDIATLIVGSDGLRGIFPSRVLPRAKYTSVADLLELGFVARGKGTTWTDEEVR
jgi:hypothetical protein